MVINSIYYILKGKKLVHKMMGELFTVHLFHNGRQDDRVNYSSNRPPQVTLAREKRPDGVSNICWLPPPNPSAKRVKLQPAGVE